MKELNTSGLNQALDTKAEQVMNCIKQEVHNKAKELLATVNLTESQVPKLLQDIISNSINPDFKSQVVKNLISELSGKAELSVSKPKTRTKKA